MRILDTGLAGLKRVQLKIHGDSRGFFVERFKESVFAEAGMPTHFVQDNHSRSAPGILRGVHYQTGPAQGKLVGCVRGRIWDVSVDLRADSPTFGKWEGYELSDMNGELLWIPPGFGHGFCVLGEEPADVMYKVTAPYSPAGDGGVKWDDPELAIAWPVREPLVSARDAGLQSFAQFKQRPVRDWG
jgi:dTDP-4-dehydrorhamnose 3,5-epimerase